MNEKEFKNLDVGKTFTCGDKKILISQTKDLECDDCIFVGIGYITCGRLKELGIIPECESCFRKDGKTVVFKEVKDEI